MQNAEGAPPRQGGIAAPFAGGLHTSHAHEARGPRGYLPIDLLRSMNTEQLCKKVASVHNEFTAIIEQDGAWYIAYCLEIPGANGQGHTPDEARESLAEAIALILADRREDGLRGVPPEAIRETVIVG